MDFNKRAEIIAVFKNFVLVFMIICAVILLGLFLVMSFISFSITPFVIGILSTILILLPIYLQYLVMQITEQASAKVGYAIKLIKDEEEKESEE